ncbi:MAG TPA: hypothetical protein PLD58_12155 [Phycisphaerae bacterium]|nr:hypothetical protein [Phycisphaerae bacterium]
MLTAPASIRIHYFLPDPRAHEGPKNSARAGKEGINRKELNIYIIYDYIYTKMNSFPRHLRKDASLSKMGGNEFNSARILGKMRLPQSGEVGAVADHTLDRPRRPPNRPRWPRIEDQPQVGPEADLRRPRAAAAIMAAQRFLPRHLVSLPRRERAASVFLFVATVNVAFVKEKRTWM